MFAAGNPTNKRVRVDPDAKHHAPVTTPLAAAECSVIAALTANGSLQESQKTFFKELFSEFIQLRKALKNYEDRLTKLNEPGAVLRSAQFNFTLSASARLLEDNKEGVKQAQEASDAELLLMHDRFKDHVIKILKLEVDCVKKAIKKLIAKSIVSIATSIALVDPSLADNKACDIFQFVLDSDTANPDTMTPNLKYSEFTTANDVYDMIFEFSKEGSNQAENALAAYRHTPGRQYAVNAESPAVKTYNQVIKTLFFDSWNNFLGRDKQISDNKKMQSFLSNLRAQKSTETTALNLAELDLSDAKSVQDIIDHRVNEQTKKMERKFQNEIKNLRQQVAKNNSRGATQPSASLKKKKGSKPQPPAEEADAAASGSSKNKQKQKSSNKQSAQKKKKSRKNSRR